MLLPVAERPCRPPHKKMMLSGSLFMTRSPRRILNPEMAHPACHIVRAFVHLDKYGALGTRRFTDNGNAFFMTSGLGDAWGSALQILILPPRPGIWDPLDGVLINENLGMWM
ncbi:hypothetical protein ElyMa_005536100 [Elysia marginata]|uniref:Uncharacterized protein n=1 Tax=Elysia marginata TaxID=1093978 RepID=A0AAV4EZE8_9GAST|nr:hypothetical protein ElyMa_005536100 [Elysia marginata]